MRRAVVAIVAGLLLAGCASVPTSGPVQRHNPQAPAASTGVQVAPLPPAADATQLLVVEGFLHAMSVYQDGYPVARQYLTDEAAKSWHPEAGVQVYADGYPPMETDQTVVLSATLVGQIDSTGVYQPAAGTLRIDFNLQKNADGQWRINRPPDGILVSRYLFSTGFDAVDVHYLATSGDVLVPEPRYFPVGDASLRQAAAAVLAGPSAWLAPVVRKPVGDAIRLESVTLDEDGVARVALDGSPSQVSADQQQALLAELTYTLSGFSQVVGVEVFSGAQRWLDRDGRTAFTRSTFSQLNPAGSGSPRLLYQAREGKLSRQRDSSDWSDFTEVASALPKVEGLAVNARQDAWAAVTGDGTQLVSGGMDSERSKQVRGGAGLLAPIYSRSGELWSLDSSGVSGLRVYRDGAEVKVTLAAVPKGRVVAASLSPDGVRLALVVASGGSSRLGLVRVLRTEAKVTVGGWHEIDLTSVGATGSQLLGLGWNTATELAVLRNDGTSQTSVALVSQDGATLTDIGPSDSTSLRSVLAAAGRPALALSTGGALYRFSGEFDWEVVSAGVEAAAYPG
ncbi:MAG: GerMN domain-containing protein [Propionibacteriaceae bacterium]|nr:GerMN domain-containing protein [Propionibacteriaceae bacterium]